MSGNAKDVYENMIDYRRVVVERRREWKCGCRFVGEEMIRFVFFMFI